jgi:hypothetical protein
MDVSDARRLKTLEAENGRLKRMLADAMRHARKRRAEGSVGKKLVTPAARREAVKHVQSAFNMASGVPAGSSRRIARASVIALPVQMTRRPVSGWRRLGYRRLHILLRREGHHADCSIHRNA